ncbi:SGNH/GDSL hydrolase family protein [Mucilaginibacter sp.]|uniref:SGNH/GDSL hydrolase family protein n=1 Tax=Mucilaginibacter sp. TaxID=1882438 RepID=UPI0035BBAA13
MVKRFLAAILFYTLICVSYSYSQNIIDFRDPKIHYMGRIEMKTDAAELTWTASSVIINFTGKSAKATLRDDSGNDRVTVIIDDSVRTIIQPTQDKKEYVLASHLPAGKHTLQLFKRTEYDMGKLYFYNFNIDGPLLNPPAPKHRIEFYGNSITCGFAIEDKEGKDRGTAEFENGYKSYASITARYLDADVNVIAKSGIGVIISWFDYVMPDIYNRTAANDPNTLWNFSKYTPEVVVINLFQNDSWLTKNFEHEQFKKHFGNTPPTPEFIVKAYRDFISAIRSKYPDAKIICALGNMDATKTGSPWPGYIEKAVAQLKDKAIFTHFFPYKNTGGHPSEKEQAAMAKDLTAFIKSKTKW